jgi:hypothetical protein
MNVRWVAAMVATGVVCAALAASVVWWFVRDTGAAISTRTPDRVVGVISKCDFLSRGAQETLTGSDCSVFASGLNQRQTLTVQRGNGEGTYSIDVSHLHGISASPIAAPIVLGQEWPPALERVADVGSVVWCHIRAVDGTRKLTANEACRAEGAALGGVVEDVWKTLLIMRTDLSTYNADVPPDSTVRVGATWHPK